MCTPQGSGSGLGREGMGVGTPHAGHGIGNVAAVSLVAPVPLRPMSNPKPVHRAVPGTGQLTPASMIHKKESPLPHQQTPVSFKGDRNKKIEEALLLLQREANFSEPTMQVLRQAVAQGRVEVEGNKHQAQSQSSLQQACPAEAPRGAGKRAIKPPSSKRQQLTVAEAVEIYSIRPRARIMQNKSKIHCRVIAPKYGVTAKTIRDVWMGRTWVDATRHLWTPEEVQEREERKAMGFSPSEHGTHEGHHHLQGAVQASIEPKRNTSDMSQPAGEALMVQELAFAGGTPGGMDQISHEHVLRQHLNHQLTATPSPQQNSMQYQYQVTNPAAHPVQYQYHPVAATPAQQQPLVGYGQLSVVLNNIAVGALQPAEPGASRYQQTQHLVLQDPKFRFSTGQGTV